MAKSKGAKGSNSLWAKSTPAGRKRLAEMKNEPAPREGWENARLEDDEPKKGAKGTSTADVSLNVR